MKVRRGWGEERQGCGRCWGKERKGRGREGDEGEERQGRGGRWNEDRQGLGWRGVIKGKGEEGVGMGRDRGGVQKEGRKHRSGE